MHGNGLTPATGHPKAYEIGQTSVIYDPVVMTKHDKITIGDHTRIDSFVKIEGGEGVVIGDNVHIASFCHVNAGGGSTVIQDGATMASGAKVISGGHQPEGISCSIVAPEEHQVIKRGAIVLERNSILYAGAIVYAGHGKSIIIGEGARIGAKSLVLCDVPAGELWAGVPARKIR